MRTSPSIVPHDDDQEVYLVLDDLGRLGLAWRETNPNDADLETVIHDLLEGQYYNPVRIVGFNTAEGWSIDASEDIAKELRSRCDAEGRDVPDCIRDFVDRFEAREGQNSEPG